MNATFIIDEVTGNLTVEGLSEEELTSLTAAYLPPPVEINCARPLAWTVPTEEVERETVTQTVRVHRVYHGAVSEGPGRRSVLQMQFCPLKCPGCYVPETHDAAGGVEISVDAALDLLLVDETRDGVTLLGGEPFAQPDALLALVKALRARGEHITVYSGFTIENLLRRKNPAFREILGMIDLLIDGRYMQALSAGAGEWRGSSNQRLLDKAAISSFLSDTPLRPSQAVAA